MNLNALSIFSDISEGLVIYLGFILVAKYLFFEKGIAGKEQITFHLLTLFGIISASVCSGDFVSTFVIIMGAIWIVFGRESLKITGVLLAVPIMGIMDGLFVPFVVMPGYINKLKGDALLYNRIILQTIFILILVFVTRFLAKHSAFFDPARSSEVADALAIGTTANRSLSKVEKGLLCFVGIFELLFSNLLGIERPVGAQMWFSGFGISKQDYTVILLGISTFIMTVIVIIVVLVGNKRVYYSDKVSDMQFNIIVMMAEIVENRDENTGGHIQRTAKYVEIIADNLKRGPYKEYMTDQFINDIKVAAPLHDIGKIHVSDLILNKPGRLTSEEFEIMKTHAEEGRKLLTHTKAHLGEFSYLDMAIDMAAYHHEWWDGSAKGYPEHLSGEAIPLCARIMAVADVFDALTAKRCYKEAMPVKKAIKIIKSETGTHFDPIVVDAFLDSINLIEEAFNSFEKDVVNAVNN